MRNPLNNALFGKKMVNRALFLECPVCRYTANSLWSRSFPENPVYALSSGPGYFCTENKKVIFMSVCCPIVYG
jgi:hypothetical protein